MQDKKPLEKLKRFIASIPELRNANISIIKEGHNRGVFLLKTGTSNLVARVENNTNDGGSSIDKELIFLSFLNQKQILFVPEIKYYSRLEKILIETFVAKKPLDFEKIALPKLSLFAEQLSTIHKIPASEFFTFCKERDFPQPKKLSDLANIQLYGVTHFRRAKKTCPDNHIIKWIEPRLLKNIEASRLIRRNNYHLIWGDIGTNLLTFRNKLFFIDFEFSGVGLGSELSYIKIHSHLKPSSFKILVKKYSEFSGITISELYKEIRHEERIIRLNDVIWAAMKWGESVGSEKEKEYKALTLKRIKLFKKLPS